jgi:uncharacterized protein YcbX
MIDSGGGKTVGRVVGLWRYPVKSMGGESLATADVSWHGISGDRRWAFVRPGATRSSFPWLTIRKRADMGRFIPVLTDPDRPETSPTIVRTPDGREFDVADPALGSELHPEGARVIRQERGVFDAFPISLISVQTIEKLGALVGARLDVRRFRPNLLIDAASDQPFSEDGWVGCVLTVGEMKVRVDKRDSRCVVITVDPTTDERRPAILRAVADERQGCLGVYGSIVQPGAVALNNAVRLEPASSAAAG